MKHKLTDKLKTLVRDTPDRYAVHEQCKPILEEMSGSKDFLYDIIRYNLSNPDFLQRKRTYPTLSLNIVETADFTLVVNIFPPLPDRRTDISFQSIHHHGSLLLSTVGVMGPGYQSILFKKDFTINKNGDTDMQIERAYKNKIGQVDFVDANQPHIVFYPNEISATYAFWCNKKKQAKDAIKKVSFLKNIKKPIVKTILFLGLSKPLGLNKIEYFDFYSQNGKLFALKERLAYNVAADNKNYLQNIFYFVQQSGFSDDVFLNRLLKLSTTPENAKHYIQMLIEKITIKDSFFAGHLNIPKVNLAYSEVLKAAK